MPLPSWRLDGERGAGLPDEATCATLGVASSPNGEPTRVYERPHDPAGHLASELDAGVASWTRTIPKNYP